MLSQVSSVAGEETIIGISKRLQQGLVNHAKYIWYLIQKATQLYKLTHEDAIHEKSDIRFQTCQDPQKASMVVPTQSHCKQVFDNTDLFQWMIQTKSPRRYN